MSFTFSSGDSPKYARYALAFFSHHSFANVQFQWDPNPRRAIPPPAKNSYQFSFFIAVVIGSEGLRFSVSGVRLSQFGTPTGLIPSNLVSEGHGRFSCLAACSAVASISSSSDSTLEESPPDSDAHARSSHEQIWQLSCQAEQYQGIPAILCNFSVGDNLKRGRAGLQSFRGLCFGTLPSA